MGTATVREKIKSFFEAFLWEQQEQDLGEAFAVLAHDLHRTGHIVLRGAG